jgi:hypothetical protein
MRAVGAAKGANLNSIMLQKPERAMAGRIGPKRAQECYG